MGKDRNFAHLDLVIVESISEVDSLIGQHTLQLLLARDIDLHQLLDRPLGLLVDGFALGLVARQPALVVVVAALVLVALHLVPHQHHHLVVRRARRQDQVIRVEGGLRGGLSAVDCSSSGHGLLAG